LGNHAKPLSIYWDNGTALVTRTVVASDEQMLEVFRLADEGMSVRRIALQVFFDHRLKGRVERLLARRHRGLALADPGGLDALVREMSN
jgi:hypothetical protein